MPAPLDIDGVVTGEKLARESVSEIRWDLEMLRGRVVEISGRQSAGKTSTALELIEQSHLQSRPAAWISIGDEQCFFPPDVAERAIDLESLPVICVDTISQAQVAADELVKSGGIDCVVVENMDNESVSTGLMKRLVQNAERHNAAVAFLTEKPRRWSRISPIASLRVDISTVRTEDGFLTQLDPLVDKRHGPSWELEKTYDGPPGLY
jgi:hypothetical protein